MRDMWIRDPETGAHLAEIFPASLEGAATVMSSQPEDPDGRSEWTWVRLLNGDLMLATFPQGATYEKVEEIVATDCRKAKGVMEVGDTIKYVGGPVDPPIFRVLQELKGPRSAVAYNPKTGESAVIDPSEWRVAQ
jgi:hypothetical protein